jgi:quinol monooxygenase YgiN
MDAHGNYDINIGDFANAHPAPIPVDWFASDSTQEIPMLKYALFARLEAKPGKSADVAKFLETGLQLANRETTTPIWFALQLGPTTFGVFDAFADESGRQAHLNGPIAQALMAQAPVLFAKPPTIEQIDVLGVKLS